MFNIKDFTTSINTDGVIKTNKYEVSFTLPTNHYLSNRFAEIQRILPLRCENVQLPGVSFASADGPPRYGYGPIEKNPYIPNFDDITVTFLIDRKSIIHKFMYQWVNTIVNYDSAKGGKSIKGTSNLVSGMSSYEVGYKDRYVADVMEVNVYSDTGKKNMTLKAYRVAPNGFPSQSLAWDNSDLFRISIPFSYVDYNITYELDNES